MSSPSFSPSEKTVCVTGASGFLGAMVVKKLLERGYNVRGTVRDPNNKKKTQHLLDLPNAAEKLSLFKSDLMEEGSFDEAVKDCDGVFHTASPFFFSNMTEENVCTPAIAGTLNVLNSIAKYPSIKRVVLTSSMVATSARFGEDPDDHVATEADWSNEEKMREFGLWYPLGKTLAEKAAWKFVKDLGDKASFDLVTINPPYIIGTMLQPNLNESSEFVQKFVTGEKDEIALKTTAFVDVQDVAVAHVRAFEVENASGRYVICSSSPYEEEICDILRKLCPEGKIPSKVAEKPEDFTVMGPRQPARLLFSTKKATDELGMSFSSTEKMLKDCVDSLRQHKFIDC